MQQSNAIRSGLDHQWVHAEHLLQALLTGRDGLAGATLDDLGVDTERARQAFRSAILSPTYEGPNRPPTGKRIIERAHQEEARGLGHNWVGTEHFLLALLARDRRADGLCLESRPWASPTKRLGTASSPGPHAPATRRRRVGTVWDAGSNAWVRPAARSQGATRISYPRSMILSGRREGEAPAEPGPAAEASPGSAGASPSRIGHRHRACVSGIAHLSPDRAISRISDAGSSMVRSVNARRNSTSSTRSSRT